ncbi:glycoside hydrolase family 49 protein [Parathielavia appendiculata]|uniref:Glycoside hydrolase family 49 protein n=1 Tax=Parathielavia appendiculata TaxID=2587402 RepID=A0AAN6TRA3_9PEZI|nr:glycoside hydrolase family 49 protein [Parathielavia appendiculata]
MFSLALGWLLFQPTVGQAIRPRAGNHTVCNSQLCTWWHDNGEINTAGMVHLGNVRQSRKNNTLGSDVDDGITIEPSAGINMAWSQFEHSIAVEMISHATTHASLDGAIIIHVTHGPNGRRFSVEFRNYLTRTVPTARDDWGSSGILYFPSGVYRMNSNPQGQTPKIGENHIRLSPNSYWVYWAPERRHQPAHVGAQQPGRQPDLILPGPDHQRAAIQHDGTSTEAPTSPPASRIIGASPFYMPRRSIDPASSINMIISNLVCEGLGPSLIRITPLQDYRARSLQRQSQTAIWTRFMLSPTPLQKDGLLASYLSGQSL